MFPQINPNSTETSIPKFATISTSTSASLVAAVSAKRIRVLSYVLSNANTGVNAKFQSAAGGTDITGLHYLSTSSVASVPFSPVGWFQTAAGQALYLSLSATASVGGELVYVETD